MSLSYLALVVYVFLQAAVYLAWFAVSNKLLGIVGIIFVVLAVLEALGVFSYTLHLPARRQQPQA
jgi:hypothetical protein